MYPKAKARLLTLTGDALPADCPPGVTARPACEWLLSGNPC